MNYQIIKSLRFQELKQMACDMDLSREKSSQLYIDSITKAFKEYEDYKHEKIDRYTKIKQLGVNGKEGVVYLVKDRDTECMYAMKCFKKSKSSKTLCYEIEMQRKAAEVGISPNIVDFDTVSKYIVMEKLDTNLFDMLKKQHGRLSIIYQKQLIRIFEKLDDVGVFHSDANPLNFMIKNKKMYIIDYGFARRINTSLIKKYDTTSPNMKFMVLGFLLRMKELAPDVKYEYLESYVYQKKT
jgi:serine/threonine protein kinase